MGLEVPPPSSEQASWGAAFQNPLEPASPTICKLWGPASQTPCWGQFSSVPSSAVGGGDSHWCFLCWEPVSI